MNIAAIYFDGPDYIFDEPQTISLNGKYTYHIENILGEFQISKKINLDSTPDDFFASDSKISLTNVSVLVGENGTGKTTILKLIHSFFSKDTIFNYGFNFFIVLEVGSGDNFVIYSDKFQLFNYKYNNKNIIIGCSLISDLIGIGTEISAIYYTPHLNLDYAFNSLPYSSTFFSLDSKIQDASKLGQLYTREFIDPLEELLYSTSLKEIEFLNSSFFQNHKEKLRIIIDFPNQFNPIFKINTFHRSKNLVNVPKEFHEIIERIYDRIDLEILLVEEKASGIYDNYKRHLEIQKSLFVLQFIKNYFNIIVLQMNRANSFLVEGSFDEEFLEDDLIDLIVYFLKNSFLKLKDTNEEKMNAFDYQKITKFIKEVTEGVKQVSNLALISDNRFQVTSDLAKKILLFQKEATVSLSQFHRRSRSVFREEIIPNILSYAPLDRRLSSGEQAMINLFSTFYHYVQNEHIDFSLEISKAHYLILLDEADLSFHPAWKKKFVLSIVTILPLIFEESYNAKSISVVFTTHDALTLSDIPNRNVIFLKKNQSGFCKILGFDDDERPRKNFAANISEILADSFFINDSLIGDFSRSKIEDIIESIEKYDKASNSISLSKRIKALILLIDEPIIQRKLAEMYSEKSGNSLFNEVIDIQIRHLQYLKSRNQ